MKNFKELFVKIHVLIFGYKPTNVMVGFLKNLSWSFVGVVGSVGVLFFVSILGARILGPEEYGKYSLAISLANIIAVISALGFDQAAVKFSSEHRKDVAKRNMYYVMSLTITTVISSVVIIILLFARTAISSLTGIDALILVTAGLFALVLGLRQSCEVYFRGAHLFKDQAIVKIVEALASLVILLLAFKFIPAFGFTWYMAAVTVVSLLVFIVCFFKYLRLTLGSWRRSAFTEMKSYALSGVYISIIGILTLNLDRFFLNGSLGAAEVGIYSAYMLIPSMFANYFSTAVVNVFFPTITQLPDKQMLLKRVRKIGAILAVPVSLVYAILGYIILSLLGKEYRMDLLYLSLVSVYGFLLIYVAMVAAVIGSSESTYISYARSLLVKLIIILSLYVALFKLGLITIPVLVLILMASVLVDIALFFRAGRLLT